MATAPLVEELAWSDVCCSGSLEHTAREGPQDRSGGGAIPLARAASRHGAEAMPVKIGNWDLVRMLGSGAEADVFLAQHRGNARRVAVKLVRHGATSFYDRR